MKYIVVEFEEDKVVTIYNLQGKTMGDAKSLIDAYKRADKNTGIKNKQYKIYQEVE